jgi:hypothetical protein
MKVEKLFKIFINTFKRNPDLWLNFKNVVDGLSEELQITPTLPTLITPIVVKNGKESTRLPNEDVSNV